MYNLSTRKKSTIIMTRLLINAPMKIWKLLCLVNGLLQWNWKHLWWQSQLQFISFDNYNSTYAKPAQKAMIIERTCHPLQLTFGIMLCNFPDFHWIRTQRANISNLQGHTHTVLGTAWISRCSAFHLIILTAFWLEY